MVTIQIILVDHTDENISRIFLPSTKSANKFLKICIYVCRSFLGQEGQRSGGDAEHTGRPHGRNPGIQVGNRVGYAILLREIKVILLDRRFLRYIRILISQTTSSSFGVWYMFFCKYVELIRNSHKKNPQNFEVKIPKIYS